MNLSLSFWLGSPMYPKLFPKFCQSWNWTFRILKTHFEKQNPKLIVHQKYRNFDNLLFQEEFLSKLKDLLPNDKSLKGFQDSCLQILNSLAPLQTKYACANQAPFMNKELQKAKLLRSKLRNKYSKNRSESNKKTILQTKKYLC